MSISDQDRSALYDYIEARVFARLRKRKARIMHKAYAEPDHAILWKELDYILAAPPQAEQAKAASFPRIEAGKPVPCPVHGNFCCYHLPHEAETKPPEQPAASEPRKIAREIEEATSTGPVRSEAVWREDLVDRIAFAIDAALERQRQEFEDEINSIEVTDTKWKFDGQNAPIPTYLIDRDAARAAASEGKLPPASPLSRSGERT